MLPVHKYEMLMSGCHDRDIDWIILQQVRVQDEAKLPVSWLAGNTGETTLITLTMIDNNHFIVGEHATSMDALWALRDFMLQEALGVVKIM